MSRPPPYCPGHMQTETEVRRATNAAEAMAALAKGIDALLALTVGRSDDAWFDGDWPTSGPVTARATLNEKLTAARRAGDGDEIRALAAQLALLADEGRIPVDPVAAGTRAEIDYKDGMIVLPPADTLRKQHRITWLAQHCEQLLSFYPGGLMTRDVLHDGYTKGGPLWLYYQDNRKLLEMPVEWRREFVDDIFQDSPAAAHEIARDILKDAESVSPGDVVEALSA